METIFKLGVIFSLVDKLTKGVGRIKRTMDTVGRKARSTAKILGAFALGAGIALIPTVKTYATFEKTIAAVGVISKATEGDLKRIENRAIELGINTERSSNDAAQGFLNLAKAGFTIEQQLKAIRPSLLLATAGQLELGQAASTTAVGIKAFNLGAGDAARVVDVLTSATQSSRLRADEFEQALGQLGPAATGANQPFELMVAALGLMKDQGGTAVRRAEQLKTALVAIRAPTGAAAAEISKLVRDSAGGLLPLPDVIDRISERIQHLSKSAQDRAVVKIFGREGLPVFDALRKAQFTVNGEVLRGTDALRAFDKSLRTSQGTGQRFADVFLATFAGRLQLLKGSLETFANVTGKLFAEKMRPWVDALRTGVNVLIKWTRENPEAARKFADTASKVGLLTTGLIAASLGLSLLMLLLKPFLALFTFAFFNPIGLGITAVLALAVAIAILVRRWDDFKDAVANSGSKVAKFFKGGARDALQILGIVGPRGAQRPGGRNLRVEEIGPGVIDVFQDELGKMVGELGAALGQGLGFKTPDAPPLASGGGASQARIFQIGKLVLENVNDPQKLAEALEDLAAQLLPTDAPPFAPEE